MTPTPKPAESDPNEINMRLVSLHHEAIDLGSAAKRGAIPMPLDWYGCPVYVDETLPAGRIELRDPQTGHVLARIDTEIYPQATIHRGAS